MILAAYLSIFLMFGAGQVLNLKNRGLLNRREVCRVSLGLCGMVLMIFGMCPPLMGSDAGLVIFFCSMPILGAFIGMTFWEELKYFLTMLAAFSLAFIFPGVPCGICHFTMGPDAHPQTVAAGFMAILIWIGFSYLFVRSIQTWSQKKLAQKEEA